MTKEMINNTTTSKAVFDELLNLADSNWVLGHWYLICILNSRSLQDGSAMSAMAQDSLGHTRATLHFLEKSYDYEDLALEFGRDVDEIHGMDALDASPKSWSDFVVTLLLGETAVWKMMSTFENSTLPAVSGMLESFAQENQFHRMNMDGWLKNMTDEEVAKIKDRLTDRLGRAIAWFGSEEASKADPLLKDGVRGQSVWEVRQEFIDDITEKLNLQQADIDAAIDAFNAADYDNERRRPEGVNLPPRLWEAMVPTSEAAKMARRPLVVSITDELDLYDRPNSKDWDFEPLPI